MQDSNATTATGAGGRARWEPGTDRTTTTRVSSSAGAPLLLLSPYSFFFPDTGCLQGAAVVVPLKF